MVGSPRTQLMLRCTLRPRMGPFLPHIDDGVYSLNTHHLSLSCKNRMSICMSTYSLYMSIQYFACTYGRTQSGYPLCERCLADSGNGDYLLHEAFPSLGCGMLHRSMIGSDIA